MLVKPQLLFSSLTHQRCSRLFLRHALVREFCDTSGADDKRDTSTSVCDALSFDEMCALRRGQAARSLVVQVAAETSAATLAQYLSQCAGIRHMFHLKRVKKCFFLVELDSEQSLASVLERVGDSSDADSDNNIGATRGIPVCSPLLWLRASHSSRAASSNRQCDVSYTPYAPACDKNQLHRHLINCNSLDEQIGTHHQLCCLTELGSRLRFFTCQLLERVLSSLLPSAEVRPFGSSVSGFGLDNCDADMALLLRRDVRRATTVASAPNSSSVGDHSQPHNQMANWFRFYSLSGYSDEAKYAQRVLLHVALLIEALLPGFNNVRKILHARVPILKFYNSMTGVECDLSMIRDGLVASSMLYTMSQLDSRVAPLVMALRRWASLVGVTRRMGGNSGVGHWISNFGLTMLIIHFLQTRSQPVLPPGHLLLEPDTNSDLPRVGARALTRVSATWSAAPRAHSVGTLLTEFLEVYSQSGSFCGVKSLLTPALTSAATMAASLDERENGPLFVANPVHARLNVCRNVTEDKLELFGLEARRCRRLLEDPVEWRHVLIDGGKRGFSGQQHQQVISAEQLLKNNEEPPQPTTRPPLANSVTSSSVTKTAASAGSSDITNDSLSRAGRPPSSPLLPGAQTTSGAVSEQRRINGGNVRRRSRRKRL